MVLGELSPPATKLASGIDCFSDETSTIQVGRGGRLDAFKREARVGDKGVLRRFHGHCGGGFWHLSKSGNRAQQQQSPVFFMLPPTTTAAGRSLANCFYDWGFRPESNKRVRVGQGYEGVSRRSPKVFSLPKIIRCCIWNYAPVISRRLTRSDDFRPRQLRTPIPTLTHASRLRRHYWHRRQRS